MKERVTVSKLRRRNWHTTNKKRLAILLFTLLLLPLVTPFSQVAAQSCVAPPSGLVSWWPGEGNANDIADGNDGTLQNGATFAAGKVGLAFSFDGVDDSVLVADSANLRVSSFTLDAWINTADATLVQPIIAKAQASGNWVSYMLRIQDGGKLSLIVENRAENRFAHWRTLSTLSSNIWHHVAGTWQNLNGDSTDAKIYIDGVEQAIEMNENNGYSSTFVPGYTTEPLYTGRDEMPSGHFKGLVDEVEVYDRALSASEIQAIFDAGSAGKCKPECTPPPPQMVSWWPGDGNANDIADANHGTLQNGATFASGKVGQAFSFDGADDGVTIPDAANLDVQNAFTIDAWVKIAEPIVTAGIIERERVVDTVSVGYNLRTDSAGTRYRCNIDNGPTDIDVISTTQITLGTFQHVACTFDGSTLRIYVDGVLENSIAAPVIEDINEPVLFGRAFKGLLDEVEIFNRALTADEIQDIFDAGSAGKCKKTDHFLCYKAKTTPGTEKFLPVSGVTLTDQFGPDTVEVKKPVSLCTPADKNGEGITDPVTHLKGYQIKPETAHVPQTNIKVVNQFGELFMDTIKPDRLLVPTSKSLLAPPDEPGLNFVDHYKCYKVKVTPGTDKFPKGIQATVKDQFNQPKLYDIKKPRRLCNPVDKNGEGIKDDTAHLMCYQAKPASGQPKHIPVTGIFVNNQFGPEQLDAIKEEELCVPSNKTLGGP